MQPRMDRQHAQRWRESRKDVCSLLAKRGADLHPREWLLLREVGGNHFDDVIMIEAPGIASAPLRVNETEKELRVLPRLLVVR